MWPLISIIAGVLMDRQNESKARTQGEADIWMNRARELNPRMNTAPYDAMRMNQQLDNQRGQSVAKLLPLALQLSGAFGGQSGNEAVSSWGDRSLNHVRALNSHF